MALGTRYKRNVGQEDRAADERMSRARVLAREQLGGDLALASRVVLGRIALAEARRVAAATLPNGNDSLLDER